MGNVPDGSGPWSARGSIGFIHVSMTASLAAVFLPVLFMGGIVGAPAPRVRGGHRRRGHVSGRGSR